MCHLFTYVLYFHAAMAEMKERVEMERKGGEGEKTKENGREGKAKTGKEKKDKTKNKESLLFL